MHLISDSKHFVAKYANNSLHSLIVGTTSNRSMFSTSINAKMILDILRVL